MKTFQLQLTVVEILLHRIFTPRRAEAVDKSFYHASYASTVLAVMVCPSVCLSVCRKSELYKDG